METYDILVNFKENPYEFYEWERNDLIYHIKNIKAYRVGNGVLNDLTYNDFKVDIGFLKDIYGTTEFFSNGLIKLIDYACVFYDDYEAIAFLFNKEGICVSKSKLLLDEEEDIISEGCDKDVRDVGYQILKNNKYLKYVTRKEASLINKIKKSLVNAQKNKDEILYLYYECFNTNILDDEKALKRILKSVDDADVFVLTKLKNFLKVLKS